MCDSMCVILDDFNKSKMRTLSEHKYIFCMIDMHCSNKMAVIVHLDGNAQHA